MTQKKSLNFGLCVIGGIILGALIDNMAIGLILGFAVGFGLLGLNRSKS